MKRAFAEIATIIAQQSGRPTTFVVALLFIGAWAVTGPIFHFSDTWQLIINTSTTIITFLMVFVIQNTQNRDGAAIQAKLDELIRVTAARNTLIGIETLTQDEIEEIRATCAAKAHRAANRAITRAFARCGRRWVAVVRTRHAPAKDFRTWAGTVLAAMALNELESFDSAAQAKRNLRCAIEKVSARLGNTPTICRKCYVHPEVLNSYMDGNLVLELKSKAESEPRGAIGSLKPEEAAVLALLRGRLAKESQRSERSSKRAPSSKLQAKAA